MKMSRQPCVLIIDDDPAVVIIVSDVIRALGYQDITARNGADGLRKVREGKPDLIILDIMMPEVDGYEVCRKLRARPETWYVPILMLTARGQAHEIAFGLELGADDYLAKPYAKTELEARVKALLRRYPPLYNNDQVDSSILFVQHRTDPKYLLEFNDFLAYRFSVQDLKALCFSFGIDYEDLEGSGKSNKCRELIMYFERRGCFSDLVDAVKRSRPNLFEEVDES